MAETVRSILARWRRLGRKWSQVLFFPVVLRRKEIGRWHEGKKGDKRDNSTCVPFSRKKLVSFYYIERAWRLRKIQRILPLSRVDFFLYVWFQMDFRDKYRHSSITAHVTSTWFNWCDESKRLKAVAKKNINRASNANRYTVDIESNHRTDDRRISAKECKGSTVALNSRLKGDSLGDEFAAWSSLNQLYTVNTREASERKRRNIEGVGG